MHYLHVTSWIFVALLLLVVFLFFFPTPTMIGIAGVGVHLLVGLLVVVVLRSNASSEHTFAERWYEEHEG